MKRYFFAVAVLFLSAPLWAKRGSVYVSFGQGSVHYYYYYRYHRYYPFPLCPDTAHGYYPTEGYDTTEIKALNVRTGGHFDITPNIFIGGALYLQQKWIKNKITCMYSRTTITDTSVYSYGLQPQDIAIYLGSRGSIYSAAIGLLIDIGSYDTLIDRLFIDIDRGSYSISDDLNAVFARLKVHTPKDTAKPNIVIGGYVEDYYAPPNQNWFVFGLFWSFVFPNGEAAMDVQYASYKNYYYIVTLNPYLQFNLPNKPVGFIFKLSTYNNEYVDYGIYLTKWIDKRFEPFGFRNFKPNLSFTLGTTVRL